MLQVWVDVYGNWISKLKAMGGWNLSKGNNKESYPSLSKTSKFIRTAWVHRHDQMFRSSFWNVSHVAATLKKLTLTESDLLKWEVKFRTDFERLEKLLWRVPIMQALNWSLPFRCSIVASALTVRRNWHGAIQMECTEIWRTSLRAFIKLKRIIEEMVGCFSGYSIYWRGFVF